MKVQLDLDAETAARLIDAAMADYRSIPWQATVILRRALGLTVPIPQDTEAHTDAARERTHA